jgi:hypothetical protein
MRIDPPRGNYLTKDIVAFRVVQRVPFARSPQNSMQNSIASPLRRRESQVAASGIGGP